MKAVGGGCKKMVGGGYCRLQMPLEVSGSGLEGPEGRGQGRGWGSPPF